MGPRAGQDGCRKSGLHSPPTRLRSRTIQPAASRSLYLLRYPELSHRVLKNVVHHGNHLKCVYFVAHLSAGCRPTCRVCMPYGCPSCYKCSWFEIGFKIRSVRFLLHHIIVLTKKEHLPLIYPLRNSVHKLYIDQDNQLITLVIQGQTSFGFRENVVSVIARYFTELTVNIMCY